MGNCWQVWARAWGLVHERGEREVWSGGMEGNYKLLGGF